MSDGYRGFPQRLADDRTTNTDSGSVALASTKQYVAHKPREHYKPNNAELPNEVGSGVHPCTKDGPCPETGMRPAVPFHLTVQLRRGDLKRECPLAIEHGLVMHEVLSSIHNIKRRKEKGK